MDGLDGTMRDAIRRAIEYLASVCDHASSLDSIGFSANTASIGHELANLPDRYWNEGTFVAAARIAHRHRAQAIGADVLDETMAGAMKSIADGPGAEDIETGWLIPDRIKTGVVLSVSREMAEIVRILKKLPGASQPAGRGRLWAVDAKHCFALLPYLGRFEVHEGADALVRASMEAADPDMVLASSPKVVDAAEGMLAISFPYDAEAVAEIKRLRRRRYDGKRWLVDPVPSAAELVQRMCSEQGFVATGAAQRLMESATTRSDEQGLASEGAVVSSTMIGGRLVLSFKYDAGVVGAIKTLPPATRSYSAERRTWSIARDSLPDLIGALEALESPPTRESLDALRAWAPQPGLRA